MRNGTKLLEPEKKAESETKSSEGGKEKVFFITCTKKLKRHNQNGV